MGVGGGRVRGAPSTGSSSTSGSRCCRTTPRTPRWSLSAWGGMGVGGGGREGEGGAFDWQFFYKRLALLPDHAAHPEMEFECVGGYGGGGWGAGG